jgi:hypothetical protein
VNLAGYLVAVDDLPGALAAVREVIGVHAACEPDHYYIAIAIEHLALATALRGDLTRAATFGRNLLRNVALGPCHLMCAA